MSVGTLAVSAVLTLNADRFISGINSGIDALRDFGRAATSGRGALSDFVGGLDAAKWSARAGAGALALWTAGLHKAADAASKGIQLEIAVTKKGDPFEKTRKDLAELRTLALETSKSVTGTMGDIEGAFGVALKKGATKEDLGAGMGRTGSLLADAFGTTKPQGIEAIRLVKEIFGMKAADSTAIGDMIAKTMFVSGFDDLNGMVRQFSRGGDVLSRLGAKPEDALLLLAGASRIGGSERAGTSMEAFYRELGTKEKQGKVRAAGLGGLFDKSGNVVGIEEADKVMDGFVKKFKSKKDMNAKLMEIFGAEGALIGSTFMKTDFSELAKAREGVLSLEEQLKLIEGTFSFQMDAVGGTMETGFTELFRPAEKAAAKAIAAFGEKIASPFSDMAMSSDPLQKTASFGLLGGGVGALGLALLLARSKGGVIGGLAGDVIGTGAGVTKGMAVVAAAKAAGANVQMVYVVNWPATGLGAASMFAGAGGASSSGARDVVFAGEAAARTAMLSRTIFTIGSGAALTGSAALAALLAPIIIGTAGALNYQRIITQTSASRKKSEELDKTFDTKDVRGEVEKAVRTRATRGTKSKKDDMTEEEIQAEIKRRTMNFMTEGGTGPTGVVETWVDGFKRIFGLFEDTARTQKEAAAETKQAASDLRDSAPRPMAGKRGDV